MTVRRAQKQAYKASRLLGDLSAAQRGKLPQRLLRRQIRRSLPRWWTRWGL